MTIPFDPQLIQSTDVPSFLGISRGEYLKWKRDGKIPIHSAKKFRKWGATHETHYHHRDDLNKITKDVIAGWRKEHKDALSNQGIQRRENTKLAKSLVLEGLYCENEAIWTYVITLEIPVDDYLFKVRASRSNKFKIATTDLERDTLKGQLLTWKSRAPVSKLEEVSKLAIKKIVDEAIQSLRPSYLPLFISRVSEFLNSSQVKFPSILESPERILDSNIEIECRNILEEIQAIIKSDDGARAINLHEYAESFKLARSLNRQFKVVLGPTNSGKTYEAIEALKAANSGVYLAPLRLLAMEIFDKLTAEGIPCELHTGEEHIVQPGAKHICATVEMFNPEKEVEVAVIDEIQMLLDPARGWAWTAALVGVPAKEVFVVGATNVKKIITDAVDYLKETHIVKEVSRKSTLKVAEVPTSMSQIKKGDAVIAFSRKEVLITAYNLRKNGLKVSTLYGALAPEVRRAQAERFVRGESDVVVATDAIGMGLNLPIKRVVFTTVSKFDGKESRVLNATECHQIGGRAGRYGIHGDGEVSAFTSSDLAHLKKMLASPPPDISEFKIKIAPTLNHIKGLSTLLESESISRLLNFFAVKLTLTDSKIFSLADLTEMRAVANYVEQTVKNKLNLECKFIYACAPINIDSKWDLPVFQSYLHKHCNKSEIRLSSLPKWVTDLKNATWLQEAENMSKELALYSWLSSKFPEVYIDHHLISTHRAALSKYIDAALLAQKGVKDTYF